MHIGFIDTGRRIADIAHKHLGEVKSLLLFCCAAFLFWFEPNIFFANDDWAFIHHFLNDGRLNYLFTHYWGHVVPLFKCFFFAELSLFGKNAILFQATELILLSATAFAFNLLLRQLSQRKNALALSVSLLLIAHPGLLSVTLWLFQVCIVLHLLFQMLAILFYFKFNSEKREGYFWLFVLSLLAQNYSFGNGILFPMVFIIHEIVHLGIGLTKRRLVLLVVQLAIVVVQLTLSPEGGQNLNIIDRFGDVSKAWKTLVLGSISRLFFIDRFDSLSGYVGLLIFLIICHRAYRNDRRIAVFGLCYLLQASILIPIARPQIGSGIWFHYYYSILLFPPVCLLMYVAFSDLSDRKMIYLILLFNCLFVFYFVSNVRRKRVSSYIHFKNKERLLDAVHHSKEYYYPFDNKIVCPGADFIDNDNEKHPAFQRSIQKNARFEVDPAMLEVLERGDFFRRAKENMSDYRKLSGRSLFDCDIYLERKR